MAPADGLTPPWRLTFSTGTVTAREVRHAEEAVPFRPAQPARTGSLCVLRSARRPVGSDGARRGAGPSGRGEEAGEGGCTRQEPGGGTRRGPRPAGRCTGQNGRGPRRLA